MFAIASVKQARLHKKARTFHLRFCPDRFVSISLRLRLPVLAPLSPTHLTLLVSCRCGFACAASEDALAKLRTLAVQHK